MFSNPWTINLFIPQDIFSVSEMKMFLLSFLVNMIGTEQYPKRIKIFFLKLLNSSLKRDTGTVRKQWYTVCSTGLIRKGSKISLHKCSHQINNGRIHINHDLMIIYLKLYEVSISKACLIHNVNILIRHQIYDRLRYVDVQFNIHSGQTNGPFFEYFIGLTFKALLMKPSFVGRSTFVCRALHLISYFTLKVEHLSTKVQRQNQHRSFIIKTVFVEFCDGKK